MGTKFYKCRCFFKRNLYVKEFKAHVTFENEEQFKHEYKQLFEKIATHEEKSQIINKIQDEISRRKDIDTDSLQRKTFISENYKPLLSEIFHLREEYLNPLILKLTETANSSKNKADLISQIEVLSEEKELYRFPIFTEEFCKQLLLELDNFRGSAMPKGKPNSMNEHGVLLDELGFYEHFLDPLRLNYLNPIAKLLYPKWCGEGLDSHRAFTVLYEIGREEEIDCHYDNAEVTLNVCLGKEFLGGELYFGNMKDNQSTSYTFSTVPQLIGHGILHRGQHAHGTMPIQCGERHNMIIWMRSSSVRNEMCPMCSMKPDLLLANDYGDGFTNEKIEKAFCSLQ